MEFSLLLDLPVELSCEILGWITDLRDIFTLMKVSFDVRNLVVSCVSDVRSYKGIKGDQIVADRKAHLFNPKMPCLNPKLLKYLPNLVRCDVPFIIRLSSDTQSLRSQLSTLVDSKKLLYFVIDFRPYMNDQIQPAFYEEISTFLRAICTQRKVDLSALRMDLIIYELMVPYYEPESRESNDLSILIDGTHLRVERLRPDMHHLLEAIYDSGGLGSLEISYLDPEFDSDFLTQFVHLTEMIINIDEIVIDEDDENKVFDELGKLLNHDPYVTSYIFTTENPDPTRITNFMGKVLDYLDDVYPNIVYPHVTNFGGPLGSEGTPQEAPARELKVPLAGPIYLWAISLLSKLFPSIDTIVIYTEEPISPQRLAELERETRKKLSVITENYAPS